jgi:hypothetical protein
VVHPGDGDAEAVFQRTELLEFLRGFERRHREFDQPQQGLVTEAVDAQMLLERVAGQLFGQGFLGGVAEVRDRAAREVQGAPSGGGDHLDHIGVVEFGEVLDGRGRGAHVAVAQRLGHGIDDSRIHQGFIALNVDVPIGLDSCGDFGDAVSATWMVGPGHFHATESAGERGDALVIGGHDDLGQGGGQSAPLDDPLDQRNSGDGV